MNRLVPVPKDAAENQRVRNVFLSQPLEYFAQFLGGRVPTLQEKLNLVETLVREGDPPQLFCNDIYRVAVRQVPPFIHLTISRFDGETCKEWSHFQQIKNELVGPEHEAVELFPAQSRVVDLANQYHLWVYADPHYRFDLGWGSSGRKMPTFSNVDAPTQSDAQHCAFEPKFVVAAPPPVGSWRP